jgi:hypothetical protein
MGHLIRVQLIVIFKPAGQRCPHLVFEGNLAVCKIHELACYRGSPCDQFEQIGTSDDVCVMGRYFEVAEDRDM